MFERVFSQSQQFLTGWAKLWQDQLERIDSATEEMVKLQEHGAARTSVAMDEVARLQKASFQYANRLSVEWRRVGMEAWRRAAELMTPPEPAPTATSSGGPSAEA